MDNETPLPTHCPQCSAPLRAAALFCARCGTRSVPEEPAPPADPESGNLPKDRWVPEPAPSTWRWDELRVVGWLYALLLFTSLVGGIAYSMDRDGDFGFWTTLVDAVVIVAFAIRYRAEIVPLLAPSTFDLNARKKLAIAAAVQFVALGAVFYLLEMAGLPFERITDEIERHDYSLWQLLALYSLAPALFEEIAFRGVIFERLRRVLGDREGWLVQAAFFSILHLNPVIFPTHFAMGLIFGWLRMRTGSLLPGMILHAAWNAANIVLELYR
jgi:membrane protease YdiL (CAAX protease family)